jgi:hypothetical protein
MATNRRNRSARRTKKQEKVSGVVIWQGPSELTGKPAVLIATGLDRPTSNEKTGEMIQTWILCADVSPTVAMNTGDDASVCGNCPLRGIIDNGTNRLRSCYVSVRNAPRSIWESWKRGNYPNFDLAKHGWLFERRGLRMGAYGDPVAVPFDAWKPIVDIAPFRTGYSHQWRNPKFAAFADLIMASCETVDDAKRARSHGWRTFRTEFEELATAHRGEFVCPASEQEGKRQSCETCGACDGANGNPKRASVVIAVHGSPSVLSSYGKHVVQLTI